MKITVKYNDGAIQRTQVPNEKCEFTVETPLQAYREIVDLQGNGWEVADEIIEGEEELEVITDEQLQEYLDKKYNGDWVEAINSLLDDVDISGDRDIYFIEVDGKVIRENDYYEDEEDWECTEDDED
jgi:hypothetical protein